MIIILKMLTRRFSNCVLNQCKFRFGVINLPQQRFFNTTSISNINHDQSKNRYIDIFVCTGVVVVFSGISYFLNKKRNYYLMFCNNEIAINITHNNNKIVVSRTVNDEEVVFKFDTVDDAVTFLHQGKKYHVECNRKNRSDRYIDPIDQPFT